MMQTYLNSRPRPSACDRTKYFTQPESLSRVTRNLVFEPGKSVDELKNMFAKLYEQEGAETDASEQQLQLEDPSDVL